MTLFYSAASATSQADGDITIRFAPSGPFESSDFSRSLLASAFAAHADVHPTETAPTIRDRRRTAPDRLPEPGVDDASTPVPSFARARLPDATPSPAAAAPAHCQADGAEDGPEPGSLLAARIAGARAVLRGTGEEDDDVLLIAANEVHRKAVANPDDEDAQAASLALWRAEADAWAGANGAAPSVDETSRLQAYLDLWSLALDPPPPPVFQTRRDVALEYVLERARKGQSIAIAARPAAAPVDVGALIDHHLEEPEVRVRYYTQFADYVNNHLEHFSKLSAISDAASAGIPRLRLEEKPRRMWHIKSLTAFPIGSHRLPSTILNSSLGRRLGESHIAQMWDGEFLHIDASGKIVKLAGSIANRTGELDTKALLQALGRTGAEYLVAHEPCDPVLLRDHIFARRRDAVRAAITQWKTDNYLPSRAETLLRLIVPFYGLYHQVKWDPGYQVQMNDVAWDAAALAITLAGIVLTAGGGSAGIAAANASMRAAAAQGIKAMVAAGMRSLVQQFHLRVFLLNGARELTDFVLPVFSVGRLVNSAARVTPLATRALKTATARATAALRASNARLLLDGIYDVLARSGPAHRNFTSATIRQSLETAARRPVPLRIYRMDNGGPDHDQPYTAVGADATPDDILVAIIRHVACGDDGGRGLSTTAASVPVDARNAPAPVVQTIDTSPDPGKFRAIEDILLNDGPRLVQQGKLRSGTLRAAIRQALEQEDARIFYTGGSIPDTLIVGRGAPGATR